MTVVKMDPNAFPQNNALLPLHQLVSRAASAKMGAAVAQPAAAAGPAYTSVPPAPSTPRVNKLLKGVEKLTSD